jgi:hypothetical protein
LKLTQDKFQGDPEDLEAFLQLANTPIRNEKRSEALATWRDYKFRTLELQFMAKYQFAEKSRR